MVNFLSGILFMYMLAIPLFMYISESHDPENDPYAPWRFAIMWPLAALEVLFRMMLGNKDGN